MVPDAQQSGWVTPGFLRGVYEIKHQPAATESHGPRPEPQLIHTNKGYVPTFYAL